MIQREGYVPHPQSRSDLLFEVGIEVLDSTIMAGPNLCWSCNILIRSLCDLGQVTCSSGSQLHLKLKSFYELDNHKLYNYEFDYENDHFIHIYIYNVKPYFSNYKSPIFLPLTFLKQECGIPLMTCYSFMSIISF